MLLLQAGGQSLQNIGLEELGVEMTKRNKIVVDKA